MLISVLLVLQLFGCGYETEESEIQNADTIQKTSEEQMIYDETEVEQSVQIEKPVLKPQVLVDQIGYQKEDAKKAIFLGEDLADTFSVVEADTKEVIYTGSVREKGYDELTHSYVSIGEFSEVEKEGDYYIEIDPIGQSYCFSIGKYSYEDRYESVYKELLEKDLFQECADNKEIADTVTSILFTYEFYEKANTSDKNAKSEKLPPLLEAARIGCELMLNSQDNNTGSVGARIGDTESEDADYEVTYRFAAALAQFSYLCKEFDTALSKQYVNAAEKAYAYAKKSSEEEDVGYYAATQLYKATGLTGYHNQIKKYAKEIDHESVSVNDVSREHIYGDIVYLTTNAKVDAQICTVFMDELLERAKTLAAYTEKDYYLVCADDKRNIEVLLNNMFVLAVVDHVIVSHEYLVILKEQLHYLSGRNIDCIDESDSPVTKAMLLFVLGDMRHREENVS